MPPTPHTLSLRGRMPVAISWHNPSLSVHSQSLGYTGRLPRRGYAPPRNDGVFNGFTPQSKISISLPQQKGTTSPALTWTVLLQVTQ